MEHTGNKPKVLRKGRGDLVKASKHLLFSLHTKRRIVMPARNEQKSPRFLWRKETPKGTWFLTQTRGQTGVNNDLQTKVSIMLPRLPYPSPQMWDDNPQQKWRVYSRTGISAQMEQVEGSQWCAGKCLTPSYPGQRTGGGEVGSPEL